MADVKMYEGTCHCGAVRYEVTMAPPEQAFSGNCSICKRVGWLLTFAPGSAFRLISGEDGLRDYQFNRNKIHHVFCGTCGVRSFSRGTDREGNPTVAINLRCLTDFDATKLPVQEFDCAKL
jgi:hypothetical protein